MKLYKNKPIAANNLGLQPIKDFKATRRNLPHWQEPGSVYFITWLIRESEILAQAKKPLF